MLCLSRKKLEVIVIGESIRIVVLHISPTRVRIGVDVPEGTKVLRQELLEKKDAD